MIRESRPLAKLFWLRLQVLGCYIVSIPLVCPLQPPFLGDMTKRKLMTKRKSRDSPSAAGGGAGAGAPSPIPDLGEYTIPAPVVRTSGRSNSVVRLHHMLNSSTPPARASRRRLASLQSRKRTRSIPESQTHTIAVPVIRTSGIPRSVSQLHHMFNRSTPPARVSRQRLVLPTNSSQGFNREFVNGQYQPLRDSPSAAGSGASAGVRPPIPDLGGGWQGPCEDGRFWYEGRDRGRLSKTRKGTVSCYYHRKCTTFCRVHEIPTAKTMIAWLSLSRVQIPPFLIMRGKCYKSA